jgi:hypothetical protein
METKRSIQRVSKKIERRRGKRACQLKNLRDLKGEKKTSGKKSDVTYKEIISHSDKSGLSKYRALSQFRNRAIGGIAKNPSIGGHGNHRCLGLCLEQKSVVATLFLHGSTRWAHTVHHFFQNPEGTCATQLLEYVKVVHWR